MIDNSCSYALPDRTSEDITPEYRNRVMMKTVAIHVYTSGLLRAPETFWFKGKTRIPAPN
jgi:hypothetical protein